MEDFLPTPQAQVARDFMVRKGYPKAHPHTVEKVADIPCWYFYYDLPDGDLELEVYWDGQEWTTYVSSFALREGPHDPSEQLAGR